ncbi:MAG: hypothetical protein KF729_30575 [Sandaracinaceae bacterium]|nr:hypothetical protein [Sandaracinaceae bacterium]
MTYRSVALASLCLLLLACGSEAAEETPSTSGSSAGETPIPPADQPPRAPAEPAGPCPARTELTIQNAARSPHLDGVAAAFAPTMAFANVTMGRSLSLAFSSYEIARHPQFGLSVPVGVPTVPEGGMIVTMTITSPEQLTPAEYTRVASDAGRLASTGFFHSRGRVNPMADLRVTITELTAEHVCGEIAIDGSSNWPAPTGRFRAEIPRR